MSFLTNIKSLWIIIIVLIVINIFSIGAIWLTKDRKPYYRSGSYPRTERGIPQSRDQHFIPKELNFTADQQQKFDALALAHRESINLKTDEIRTLREQLVDRMKNQEFDTTSEELIQKIGHVQAELELLNFRNFRDILNISDDAQKEKFISMMQRAFRPRYEHHERDRRKDND
jgi:hypothetical protein